LHTHKQSFNGTFIKPAKRTRQTLFRFTPASAQNKSYVMLLKNHEIRYILKKAKGAGIGNEPQARTENTAYLIKPYGGYIEVLIFGARYFPEGRAEKTRDWYKGIPPTVMDTEKAPDGWKAVFWHCEIAQTL
jgi:hypothetical protein